MTNKHQIVISPTVTAITVYVADYRGNIATHIIKPRIIPATALHMNLSTRALTIGNTFQLCPLIFPWNSTDGVTYRSIDSSIVTVSSEGLVTAISPGETLVEVTTYSGVSAYCRFIVPNTDTLPDTITPRPIKPTPDL